MKRVADVAIIGGGIVGLAHAYMALRKGLRVVLFEREQFCVGASVRNFGLIWPIGQEPGEGLRQALASRAHWEEVTRLAGIWRNEGGSMHLAYADDEWAVLEEFQHLFGSSGYRCSLTTANDALSKCPSIRKEGLKGALWSETEMTVYPREAIRRIPLWLEEKYGLVRCFGQLVAEIRLPEVRTSHEVWQVERAVVCSGADFQTLYPDSFAKVQPTKCKLQMMKLVPGTPIELGPSLCAGLTLGHYAAFSKCPSLPALLARFDQDDLRLRKNGIHILVSQNSLGELIVGDSHHYGDTVEPFDAEEVNQLILQYLKAFLPIENFTVAERWHGVYPKIAGKLHVILEPEPQVQIVNGLGGAGMTLAFGLAEEVTNAW